MKKQLIAAAAGIILIAVLFIFGRTTAPRELVLNQPPAAPAEAFNIERYLTLNKNKLTAAQTLYLSTLENNISRGDVPAQEKANYQSLANFYRDSLKSFEGFAYYTSKIAKLDNSEKNLTFAAQLFLENLRVEHDEAKLSWETAEAIELFERALKLNPTNTDLKIGLGSAYIFGNGKSGDAQKTMEGIQTLLSVVKEDSTNMKAQLVLGIGGFTSGQYDKALERFQKVVAAEPGNLEAVAFLADTYAASGNKAEAIKWYNVSKRLANNEHYNKEVDKRIEMLK